MRSVRKERGPSGEHITRHPPPQQRGGTTTPPRRQKEHKANPRGRHAKGGKSHKGLLRENAYDEDTRQAMGAHGEGEQEQIDDNDNDGMVTISS